MAYHTPWDPRTPEKSKAEAERRAGPSPLGYMYRIEEVSYSVVLDAEREEYGSKTVIELIAYRIKNKTPKGTRIHLGFSNTRFVSDHTTKQFAGKTIGFALESFLARKKRQAEIYEAKASKARRLISLAQGNPCAELDLGLLYG